MTQALDNRRDLREQDLGSEPARSNATPMHGWHLGVTKSPESLLLLDSDEAVDRDFLRNSLKLSPTDGCRLIERIRIQREQSGVGWLCETSSLCQCVLSIVASMLTGIHMGDLTLREERAR